MKYKGFEYTMAPAPVFNALNGYVKIPEGHPWHGKDESEFECDAHGGITFTGQFEARLGEGWWIGFDTCHGFDNEETRKPAYVEAECKKIIDQAIKAQQ